VWRGLRMPDRKPQIGNFQSGIPIPGLSPRMKKAPANGAGSNHRCAAGIRRYLRWRIRARLRRFFRPCFRRPLPVFFTPMTCRTPLSICRVETVDRRRQCPRKFRRAEHCNVRDGSRQRRKEVAPVPPRWKSEVRNPKQTQKTEIQNRTSSAPFEFRALDLFRISSFVLRNFLPGGRLFRSMASAARAVSLRSRPPGGGCRRRRSATSPCPR
jgi:hypothetical protein